MAEELHGSSEPWSAQRQFDELTGATKSDAFTAGSWLISNDAFLVRKVRDG